MARTENLLVHRKWIICEYRYDIDKQVNRKTEGLFNDRGSITVDQVGVCCLIK